MVGCWDLVPVKIPRKFDQIKLRDETSIDIYENYVLLILLYLKLLKIITSSSIQTSANMTKSYKQWASCTENKGSLKTVTAKQGRNIDGHSTFECKPCGGRNVENTA